MDFTSPISDFTITGRSLLETSIYLSHLEYIMWTAQIHIAAPSQ